MRDQRGAVTLLVALVLSILMLSSAFVVDLGLQRVTRADLQAVADVVALDVARDLDGRTVAQLTPVVAASSQRALARNADALRTGGVTLVVDLGTTTATGFEVLTAGVPSAVRVQARAAVGFAFAGVTGRSSGAAQRSASAESSSTACFRLGTFVAAVRSGDSTVLAPLNDLLGVSLDLVSYQALAAASVRLSQLTALASIGSPQALLGGTIRYSDLVLAMADALRAQGGNAVAITALTRIANSSTALAVGAIHLGNVLNVAPTDRAALEVGLSALDIVGSARLADGQYFVGIPNLQSDVPGVGFSFTGGLNLISAAELACGAPNVAQADTAQLAGTVGIAFTNLPSINLAGLGTLQTPKGTGSLVIDAGSGRGRLVAPPAVRCGTQTAADPSTFSVAVTTNAATFRLAADVTVGGDLKLTDLLGLGLTNVITSLLGNLLLLGSKLSVEVNVTLSVGASVAGGSGTAALSVPPNDTTPISTGSTIYLDPSTVVGTVTSVKIGGKEALPSAVTALTSLVVNQLVTSGKGFFEKSLQPLIDNINQQFIGPVARMIGLRLAGADVFGVGAVCGLPRLVG